MQGSEENKLLFAEALRSYTSLGWRPIPVVVFQYKNKLGQIKRGKRPLVDWKPFQTRSVIQEDIDLWITNPFASYAGVELLTGEYQNLCFVVGVDFDQCQGQPDINPWYDELIGAMRTKTASGGLHFYFKHAEELTNDTNIFGEDKNSNATIVDLRGKGGVVVVGPTPLWSEDPRKNKEAHILARYETDNHLSPCDLPPLPPIFFPTTTDLLAPKEPKLNALSAGHILPGQDRHGVAMSLIMSLMATVKTRDDFLLARRTFENIYKNSFPVQLDKGEAEVEKMFEWALDKLYQKRGKVNYAVASMIQSARKDAKKEIKTESSRALWSTFNLKQIERAGESVIFRFDDGNSFSILSDFVLSQSKIRSHFFLLASLALPPIDNESFLAIMQSVPVVDIDNADFSLQRIVQEFLDEQFEFAELYDDKKEAVIVVKSRKYAKFDDNGKTVLAFRLPRLLTDLREDQRNLKRPDLAEALRLLGCTSITTGDFRFWTYGNS